MAELLKTLDLIDKSRWNVKIVYVSSTELFEMEETGYRESVVTAADKAYSTILTTQSRKVMGDWLLNPFAAGYAVCAGRDNQWRTGGSSARSLKKLVYAAMDRFVTDRDRRLTSIRHQVEASE